MSKERNESGQYVEKATLADVLATFDTVEGPPVVTSADVAEATDLSRDSARRKLETLRDPGRVAKRKTAGRSLYWPADYTDGETADERAETPGEGVAGASTTSPPGDRESDDTAASPSTQSPPSTGSGRAPTDAPVEIGSLSFERELTPPRREQLVAWHRYVRDSGEGVTKSDFEAWWSDDREAETGYGAGSFWEAFAKASMKQSDRFEKPNARTYRWVGDVEAE